MRKVLFLQFSAIALALVFNLNLAFGADVASHGNQSRALITSAIDENVRVTLEGNTRLEANAKNDRGRVPDELSLDHMQLQLRRAPEQEAALEQYIKELQTPGSANYHQWLEAREFGEQYGLAKEDLHAITKWLQGHGFTVNVVYRSRMAIDFSGTAGMVRQAFQTEIHRLDVDGKSHIANMSDPRIPAALAPAVVGIASLHDFKPHAMHHPKANYTFTSGGFTYQALVPGDLATIYNLNPLFKAGITGVGQTVVVVEDTNLKNPPSDWNTFRSTFGLTAYTGATLTTLHPASSGTNNCANPGVNGDDAEASLDVEWATAAAPSAAIELISCADTAVTFGGIIAVQNLINASSTPPAIMSMSYGECEALTGATLNAMFNSAFQQAVTEGVSVFVSSGDDAAAGCDRDATAATHGIAVTGWGETPYNVAVGGTDFSDLYSNTVNTYWNSTNSSTYESAISYIPEIPWNDSCAGKLLANFLSGSTITYGTSGFCNTTTGEEFLNTIGGSGGPSKCATGSGATCKGYAKPSWQTGLGVPADGVRDIPDVSLFASNGFWGHYYVFCYSDATYGGTPCTLPPSGWAGAGGTSFSSPIMAGIQALVNQKNGSPQGNPNVVYYALAANEYGTTGDPHCNSSLGNKVATSCIFYDVTEGDMDVNCTGSKNCYLDGATNGVLSTSDKAYRPAYGTTKGWDFATGLGTVNALNLVKQWKSVAP
jgi:subtilase family serine protease